ncbi:S41 family peptidase [Clostridium sp. CF012]|uniref:S41 family peptidase n=1 Tax=Clostridium sp. CF012 TaxID=2843319 RepID=UPI002814BFE2|nr:S41 family peptidase [Clostridium sp. CF012]
MNKKNNKNLWIKRCLLILVIIFIITMSFLILTNKRIFDTEFDKGTNIKLENLNNNQVGNLNKLCKVWGIVKYYHPKVVTGSLNWDYELFRVMPKVVEAKDSSDVDEVLYNWINELGEVKEGVYDKSNDIMVDTDVSWIKEDNLVNKKLGDLLVKISKTNISKRNNAYVNFDKESIYTEFKNEESYLNMKYDDDGFKILSLFRYWNIIQYYYPYRSVIGEDWDAVLTEFIQKFAKCDNELSYKLTVAELTTKIHDSHVVVNDVKQVLNRYWGSNIAPIKFDLVEDKIVVTHKIEKYANDSNVQKGDVILKINDKDIFEVIKEKSKYISFSNDKAIVNNLTPYLFVTPDDSLKLTLERNGKELKENIKCYSGNIFGVTEESHKLLEGNIGYINPGALKKGEIDKIMSEFKETDGIIVDLRYYPSDIITYSLGNYLMPKKVTFAKATIANRAVPGEFIFSDELEVGNDNPNYYKGEVIIIINGATQSNGEFTAMSLRNSPNSKVIGNNSIGADGNVVTFNLPGGIQTRITGVGIYNPDKSETQRVGVKPDIYVKPTIKGIRAGRDELVEKAVELIKN